MDLLAYCQEQARRAVRARGWTSAVADDAANAATAVFYNEIQALRQQQAGAVDPSEVAALREQLATARQVADDGWAWVEKALKALGVETVFEIPDHPQRAVSADAICEAYYAKAKRDKFGPDLNYADCEWIAAALSEAVR